jgi:hypothetical protein
MVRINERNAALEAAAKIAEGEVYHGRYRTWPWWKPQADGTRGNLDKEDPQVKHADATAAAIRALMD